MITLLAENKNNNKLRAVIDLPAQTGKIKELYKQLGTESDGNIAIRYAGTGDYWGTDSVLQENCFDGYARLDEINLLAHMIDRMDEKSLSDFDVAICDYKSDLGPDGMQEVINTGYNMLGTPSVRYNGSNAAELLEAERTLLKPYPEMNKDVFWKMVDSAKAGSGDDYKQMEQKLTEELSHMSPQEILLYKDINDEYVRLADRDGIYEAGSELQYPGQRSGLGDDGFTDFRCFLIGQGKKVYMDAIQNPDSILTAGIVPYGDYYSWESFNYIASDAYTRNTGESLYDQPHAITQEQKDEISAEIEYGESNQTPQESELGEIMRDCGMEM